MKNKGIIVVGGLAALALLANKDSNSSNVAAALPYAGDTGNSELDALIQVLRNNPSVRSILRGESGANGLDGNGYKASSTSSVTIGTGSKTFNVGSGLAYSAGARVRISVANNIERYMEGVVSDYSGSTLTINIDSTAGTGTYTSWNVNVSGERGATGTHGLSGESAQNYGSSLIRNSALELRNPDRWNGVNVSMAAETFEGMPVLQASNANNTSSFFVRPDKLYKIEYWVKGTGNHSMFINLYNLDSVGAPKTDGSAGAYFKFSTAMSGSFTKMTGFVGGVGTHSTNVSSTTAIAKLSFLGHGSVLVSVAKLVVREVDLGEPVPYNNPFLPTGQTVYDPTTSKLGMYNGTAVVWVS